MKFDEMIKTMGEARRPFWNHWRQIASFIYPRPYNWLQTYGQYSGKPDTVKIVNPTGTEALQVATSGLTEGIVSRTRPWFSLQVPGVTFPPFSPEGRWLYLVRELMLEAFANTNFYNVMGEVINEYLAFGTACAIIMEDKESVFRLEPFECGSYYFDLNDKRQVRTIGRLFMLQARQLATKFDLRDDLPNAVKSAVNSKEYSRQTEKFKIGHIIMPAKPGSPFPFRSIYFLSDIGNTQKTSGPTQNYILEDQPLREWNGITPRWLTTGEEPYASMCPGMLALPEVKQLQLVEKRDAQALDALVQPPLVGDAMLKNQPTGSTPGSITYIHKLGDNVGLRPIYQVDPPINEIGQKKQELQERIRTIFMNDLFMMISRLDTVRTATEIDARREEKLTQIGPVLERFENEALDPAVKRVYKIMQRKGLIPEPPASLQNAPLEASYRSMLTEAQKAVASAAIERSAQFMGALLPAEPELLDDYNLSGMARKYNDLLNVPPEAMRSPEEAAERKQARQEAAAQQQGLDQTTQLVEGAQQLSQTDVGGGQNALQYMINGL